MPQTTKPKNPIVQSKTLLIQMKQQDTFSTIYLIRENHDDSHTHSPDITLTSSVKCRALIKRETASMESNKGYPRPL